MKFPYIFRNGDIVPFAEDTVSIDRTEVAYGFGVYETIKLRNNILYFLPQHIDRLFHSAQQINLQHTITPTMIEKGMYDLISQTQETSYNIKILLYGGNSAVQNELFMIPSAPLYPDRKWYRDGISLISFEHERWMPQAKTLNMLPSYYMFKKAQEQGHYDALLYDKNKNVREGTRTNVYVMKGKQIYSPCKKDILAGVTMLTLEKVLKQSSYSIDYIDIPFAKIGEYDSMFISSTSTKIMPVIQVDYMRYNTVSQDLKDLIVLYDSALEKSDGNFDAL